MISRPFEIVCMSLLDAVCAFGGSIALPDDPPPEFDDREWDHESSGGYCVTSGGPIHLELLKNGSPLSSGAANVSLEGLSDEQAVDIAKHSFAETPVVDDPPPAIHRENGKTVVFLPRWRRPDAPQRKFPDDWLPVWIDNETSTVVPSPDSVVSEAEAFEIAKEAMGRLNYDKNGTIKVEKNSICFVFTFPAVPHGVPGTYCGPDFAAMVGVNAETRKVMFVRVEQ